MPQLLLTCCQTKWATDPQHSSYEREEQIMEEGGNSCPDQISVLTLGTKYKPSARSTQLWLRWHRSKGENALHRSIHPETSRLPVTERWATDTIRHSAERQDGTAPSETTLIWRSNHGARTSTSRQEEIVMKTEAAFKTKSVIDVFVFGGLTCWQMEDSSPY